MQIPWKRRNFPRAYPRGEAYGKRVVERSIGVLKARFRRLKTEIECSPDFVGEIVKCCAILHNLCSDYDEFDFDVDPDDEEEYDGAAPIVPNNARRDQIVARFV